MQKMPNTNLYLRDTTGHAKSQKHKFQISRCLHDSIVVLGLELQLHLSWPKIEL